MFELFAALFGGAFLAGRSIRNAALDSLIEARNKRYREIVDELTKGTLEGQMRDKMEWKRRYGCPTYDEVQKVRWDMLREIPNEDLVYVFGANWEAIFTKERVYLPYASSGIYEAFGSIWEVAFNMWLSSKNLISSRHTSYYHIRFVIRGLPEEMDKTQVALKACKIIERNIQKKHPEYFMCINPVKNKENTLTWSFWLDNCDIRYGARPWYLISSR